MTRAPFAALLLALVTLSTSSCARLMKLPVGPGIAASDALQAFAAATEACASVETLTAQARVSGSIGGRRIRATLNVGAGSVVAPAGERAAGSRIEAYAFSQRVFTFVSIGNEATLLLDQDQRVIARAPAGEVLEAVTGVPLEAGQLKATLTGCGTLAATQAGEERDSKWRVLTAGTTSYYLRRRDEGTPWQLVAVVRRDRGLEWRIDYGRFVDRLPREIRFTATGDRSRFDLRLQLEQVELNGQLSPGVFEVKVPPGFGPMTLDELRRAGPFGAGGGS